MKITNLVSPSVAIYAKSDTGMLTKADLSNAKSMKIVMRSIQ